MQTENVANNSHKKIYVLLNTNQIKIYTYPDLLWRFLNSEPTPYFLYDNF